MNPNFFQSGPALTNQFIDDSLLRDTMQAALPQEIFTRVLPDFERLGERAKGDLLTWAEEAERQPPRHKVYNAWGERVDEIEVSGGWKQLEAAAAEEGIVATGYRREFGEYSRFVQFAKLYLYHPSSAFFSCPLAMTDGAARAIELYGDAELKEKAFRHLTSTDPKEFWTSGQWMTERTGGSDVSGTSTIAKPLGGDRYELHGTKWFTSATTSQIAMTLARIEGDASGSRGLSLFYLELRDEKGRLRNMEVHRLKDKLGTKALPTAEITMKGTPAKLIGGPGNGVKKIASLFNITRLYNSVCALGATRRILALSFSYAKKREAFGSSLAGLPLHQEILADLTAEFEGNFLLTFHLTSLLGKEETGAASADESAILRLLTPVTKLFTAKSCLAITSEALESFGGAGYVEDTGIPRWLRDAQVFSIWEGTTNVLSLDMLRASAKENALPPFLKAVHFRLRGNDTKEAEAVRVAALDLAEEANALAAEGEEALQISGRRLAFGLARICAGSLLVERAAFDQSSRSLQIAKRWIAAGLFKPLGVKAADRRVGNEEILGV
jgi:putative acyl-CoA dehydrogenase